ncbi:hypothetical protein NE237_015377 [Protea cynaroides]|uniref:B-like cyclin n=1 Tax=Protea cynaroides TaxID=273540 RepID=A0A9Q0KE54_9MAGN|nr:hypothetical protein NE237_015377 [Protea cynaroides]
MASKPVVTQQARGAVVAGGAGKQKIPLGKGNNRRALGDIGNLVPVQAIDRKPKQEFSRPLTRSFCAQLLANAQGAAEYNSKKPAAEVVNGVVEKNGAVPAKPARKKVNAKPKPDMTSKVSPAQGEEKRIEKNASHKTSKSKAQTLTSVLTARSKDACGLSNKSSDPIVNIDEADVDNHLAMADYVEDLYKFYKLEENSSCIQDYMDMQPEINEKMRAILVDWLMEVHNKFELRPETLYLTINIVDRFLSVKVVPRKELQLVGVGAMLLASKYEELWAPEVDDFVCISDRAYTREQILAVEKAILGKLEWILTVPTPYVFLVRFIKAAMADQKEVIQIENLAFFMAELGLMNYVTVKYCPSMLAASAVYVARCTLNKSPSWTETLKFHSGFSEAQLMDCAKLLANFHSVAIESKLKGVYKKYSDPGYGAVAFLPPAKILLSKWREILGLKKLQSNHGKQDLQKNPKYSSVGVDSSLILPLLRDFVRSTGYDNGQRTELFVNISVRLNGWPPPEIDALLPGISELQCSAVKSRFTTNSSPTYFRRLNRRLSSSVKNLFRRCESQNHSGQHVPFFLMFCRCRLEQSEPLALSCRSVTRAVFLIVAFLVAGAREVNTVQRTKRVRVFFCSLGILWSIEESLGRNVDRIHEDKSNRIIEEEELLMMNLILMRS